METGQETQNSVERGDLLWRIMGRFDFYINTVNAKAATLLAFNLFVFGAILTNWSRALELFKDQSPWVILLASLALLTASGAALVSIYQTFLAVSPLRNSPKVSGDYHSNIFYDHVKHHDTDAKFIAALDRLTYDFHIEDLSKQVHVLAKVTSTKFDRIRLACVAIVYFQIPAFVLLVAIKLILVICEFARGHVTVH